MDAIIISFSGIDGSGKTTYAQKLAAALFERGYNSEYCKPDYVVNEIMKKYCENEFGDPFSYIPNMNGNVYIYGILIDWLDTLNKKLQNQSNKIIVLDRYVYDILAQGLHYNANIEPMISLISHFPHPTISYFIDIEPIKAYQRLTERPSPPIHHLESLDNLEILNNCYSEVFSRINWNRTHISAGMPVEEILSLLISEYNDMLSNCER
ncbi:hypothetical protein [Paenibacillus sp. OK060]|uniref:hypothetical protein n=1 Tax=Paenibacillus sp. OK060 TaxID=1881034 RepID=UPI0015A1164F|nr:hypothetical protein [Paenibacillus sp. OK060]